VGHPIFTLAHISDLHGTPVAPGRIGPLLSKRAFGWLSWRLRRRARYRPEILDAVLEDLRQTAPDQVAVTGDLTNVSLEEEFRAARAWLMRIGDPAQVSAIPGNHDAYVAMPRALAWDLWSEYLASDAAGCEILHSIGEAPATPDGEIVFPTLRMRGPAAIVGVSSAVPTAPLFANGRVGGEQLARLERILGELALTDHFRVVLVHHPPDPGATSARRALGDAPALCALLRRTGADLVLHGHLHRTRVAAIEGPAGAIPVVGAPSASRAGSPGHYHLYEVTPDAGRRFRVTLRARGLDAGTGRFGAVGPEEGIPLVGA
jgi:3',5'-cyclic AMP phosphodiesterase CpdA